MRESGEINGLLRKTKLGRAMCADVDGHAYLSIMFGGGRMTKIVERAASFAPSLGTFTTGASSVALGTAITISGALAGRCVATGGGNDLCSGSADVTDTTQVINTPAGVTFTTTSDPTNLFGIDTSGTGPNAITLGAGPGGAVILMIRTNPRSRAD